MTYIIQIKKSYTPSFITPELFIFICWDDRIRTCGMMAPKAIVLPLDDVPKKFTLQPR